MLYVWTKNIPQVVGTCSGHHGQLISQNCVLTKIRAEPPPPPLKDKDIILQFFAFSTDITAASFERCRVIFTEEMPNNNATRTSARVVPLHLLLSELYPKVIDQLPAGHALTGCDTVAKVGTKKVLLNILNSFDPLITGFGRESLDDDMLQQAEQFLINEVTKKVSI